MNKNKFNLRNVVAIAICLAGALTFNSCEKDEQNVLSPTQDEGIVNRAVLPPLKVLVI